MKKKIHDFERVAKDKFGDVLSKIPHRGPKQEAEVDAFVDKDVEEQANEYFPVQSDSEKAAGHPIVGVS